MIERRARKRTEIATKILQRKRKIVKLVVKVEMKLLLQYNPLPSQLPAAAAVAAVKVL